MRAKILSRKQLLYLVVCFLATLQFVWCYLRLAEPYLKTSEYEAGNAPMPFQGRLLMMVPLRLAHDISPLSWLLRHSPRMKFWFDFKVTPEVVLQASIDVLSVLVAGWMTMKIYRAASRRGLLTPFVYPIFLVACGATYIVHTTQNFRFIYDLPNLAFFAIGMYLIYFRKHWAWFALLFCVATMNRETSLFLLPLFAIDRAVEKGRMQWPLLVRSSTLAVTIPLGILWIGWQIFVHHVFSVNATEMGLRVDWNLKSLAMPIAWPQMLSAVGYLPLFVVLLYRRIPDARLRAWLWMLPIWLCFMFCYGILIETRIYGELVPLIVICFSLILEELLVARLRRTRPEPAFATPPEPAFAMAIPSRASAMAREQDGDAYEAA